VEQFGPPRVTYLIARLDRGVRVLIDETVRRHGLSTPQYTTMSVVARRAGLSSAQLARRAFVTPQAMNSIVTELAAAGLVVRTPSPAHAKVLHTALSDRGRKLLEACEADLDAIEQRLLSGLSPGELEEFRGALNALVTRLSLRDTQHPVT
jgi:DNA-binding MarR family transcriptional regulator